MSAKHIQIIFSATFVLKEACKMDFNIRLSNGQILRGIIKSPGEDLRAVIIMIHGLGEHIQRYNAWAEMLSKEKFGFAGVDLPGHGRSEGKRGHVKSLAVLNEMTDILINESKKTFPGIPLFLYGHNLGGSLVLNYLIQKKPKIKGAVVTSPWLKLSSGPDKPKTRFAALMKNLMPSFIRKSGFVADHISRRSDVVKNYREDPLTHDKISVKLLNIAMDAATFALKNASGYKIPILMMHGSNDLVFSPDGSREFASKSPNVELKIWEGGYHELHSEEFSKEVFDYIVRWINARIGR